MKKSLIAVTSRIKEEDSTFIGSNANYLDAIIQAGGIPLIVPISAMPDIDTLVTQFDGLLVTGGQDIHPELYHQENQGLSFPLSIEFDKMEIKLIHAFYNASKCILGICRGMQLINVAFGGTLYQDILTQRPTSLQHNQQKLSEPLAADTACHSLLIQESGWLSDLYPQKLKVNSFHHQSVAQIATPFTVSAVSEDGLIEAMEIKNRILAVQWHPEKFTTSYHREIFRYFIQLVLNMDQTA